MKQCSLFGDSVNDSQQEVHAVIDTGTISELSFDIEATGRDPLSDSIVGIALCKEKGRSYYVPVRHTGPCNVQDALSILTPVLEDPAVAKVGHNLKYDMLMLRQEGIHVRGMLYDTMVASYLLNPIKTDHSLQDTAVEHLAHKKRPFAEVLGKRLSFAEVPIEEATQYAAEDAELAMELKDILFDKLRNAGYLYTD